MKILYSFLKKVLIVCAVIIGIIGVLLIMLFYDLSHPELEIQPQDEAFMNKVRTHLIKPGDTVKLSKLNKGHWNCVLPVVDHTTTLEAASSFLKIRPDEVVITNTKNHYVLEGNWGLAFIYYPNKVEYYRISINDYPFRDASFKCIDKKVAQLKLLPKSERLPNDKDGLALIPK